MTLTNESIHGQEGHSSTKGQEEDSSIRVGDAGNANQIGEQSSDLMISMKDLAPMLKEVLALRDAKLIDTITQQIGARYDVMGSSMEQRLKDQIAEAVQADLKAALEETVEEAVEEFLRNMLRSGSSYEREMRVFVSGIVEERLTAQLGSLLGTLNLISKSTTGLGQADTGRKSERFSASMRGETYDRIKGLGGVFSHHIQAACELYLKALG